MRMQVWSNIKSLGRHSVQTGAPFSEGERIVSFLYKTEEGSLERADLKESESEAFVPAGEILGRWVRPFKAGGAAHREEAIAKAQSAEELFWSLVDKEAQALEAAVLKQLLALWLERKRLLRAVGGRGATGQKYIQPRSGRECWVEWVQPSPDLVSNVTAALESWVFA